MKSVFPVIGFFILLKVGYLVKTLFANEHKNYFQNITK